MTRRTELALAILLALAASGVALAFEWEPDEFPEGDQSYTLEFRMGGDGSETARMDIDIVQQGDGYQVTTTMTTERSDVPREELSLAELGGEAFGLGALGPALMFGPSFMVLPMLLNDLDIHVREQPVEVLGVGRLHMNRTEEIAGYECVVIGLEPANDEEIALEFALAENLPFPCYSRYGSGDEMTEVRLINAD